VRKTAFSLLLIGALLFIYVPRVDAFGCLISSQAEAKSELISLHQTQVDYEAAHGTFATLEELQSDLLVSPDRKYRSFLENYTLHWYMSSEKNSYIIVLLPIDIYADDISAFAITEDGNLLQLNKVADDNELIGDTSNFRLSNNFFSTNPKYYNNGLSLLYEVSGATHGGWFAELKYCYIKEWYRLRPL